MTALVVHLNGGELYDVEPAATAFESTGSFAVELRNHGQAVHVHLRLDEDLSRVAAVEGTNHFVDTGSSLTVPVTVAEEAPSVRGVLEIVTGYGSGTDDVEVHLSDGDEGEPVAVDEDLGRPDRAGETAAATTAPDDERAAGTASLAADGESSGALSGARTRLRGLAGRPHGVEVPGDVRSLAAVTAVVVVGLAVAAVAILAAPDLAVVFGIFAVLVGLTVAAYLMVR